jgi:hypothetical protein
MKTKQDLIDILLKNRDLTTYEKVITFDECLGELSEMNGIEKQDLVSLFQVFTDKTGNEEVMFGLVHFIEDFELETFIQSFIEAIPKMNSEASEWVKTFHYRILNSDNAQELFRLKIKNAKLETKNIIQNVLFEISKNKGTPTSLVAEELQKLI